MTPSMITDSMLQSINGPTAFCQRHDCSLNERKVEKLTENVSQLNEKVTEMQIKIIRKIGKIELLKRQLENQKDEKK